MREAWEREREGEERERRVNGVPCWRAEQVKRDSAMRERRERSSSSWGEGKAIFCCF